MKFSSFYKTTYFPSKNSKSKILIIDLGGGYRNSFLPQASIFKIIETKRAHFLWNVGSTCNKITQLIREKNYKKVVVYGTGYSAYASIVWATFLNDVLQPLSKSCYFICINPEQKFLDLKPEIYEGIKPYVDIAKFVATRNTSTKGVIYLAHKNDFLDILPKKNTQNFSVFQTNFAKEDINYFMIKSVPMSVEGIDNVYNQFKAKNQSCTLDIATKHLHNNFPSLYTVFRSFLQEATFISAKNFVTNSQGTIVYVLSTSNQFSNSIEHYRMKFNDLEMVIIVQYTYKNLDMPERIYQAYLKLHQPCPINIIFLEIPLNNKVQFKGYRYFDYKFNYLWSDLQPNVVIINSMENRSAILGYNAKQFCPVYLLEEGLGTYVNYYNINKRQNERVNRLAVIDNYAEKSLVSNFGSEIMKKSLTGFLGFDKAYIAFPEFFNTSHAHYFHPINSYINNDLVAVDDINHEIYKLIKDETFVIYAEQPLSFPTIEYYSVVLDTLCQVVKEEKVLFCMHPRNTHNIPTVQSIIDFMGKQGKIKIWNPKRNYKVEFLVYASKPSAFYSLYSSSLTYLSIVCPNMPRYSISEILIKRFHRLDTKKTLSELSEGTYFLKVVDNEIVKNNKDIQPIHFLSAV